MTDVLANDRVHVEIDPSYGARMTSLVIDGFEVLANRSTPQGERIGDGCFPMAPWAGRVRAGRYPHDNVVTQLPVASDGNAIHGLVRKEPWQRVGEHHYRREVGAPWPSAGAAEQRYTLLDDGVRLELSWHDDAGLPATVGYHPWFLKTLDAGAGPAELTLPAEQMVRRGADHLPTGELVEPVSGPWDDCFRVDGDPVLTWPGALRLTLHASTSWWVVYDEPPLTVCVEPQTAPPDAFDHPTLQPADGWPSSLTFELRGQAL